MHVWLKAIFTCDELPLGDFGFQPKRRFGTRIPWALPKATVKTGLRPKTHPPHLCINNRVLPKATVKTGLRPKTLDSYLCVNNRLAPYGSTTTRYRVLKLGTPAIYLGHFPSTKSTSRSFAGSITTCLMRSLFQVYVTCTNPSSVWMTAG